MSKEFLHNVFGEKVPERAKYAKPEYSTKNEYGDIIPRYYVGPETDADGFDTNISEGETCYTQEWELPKGMRLCRYGTEAGTYTTEVYTNYERLGLPWDMRSVEYHEYEVIADGLNVRLIVTRGKVGKQPYFESVGGAIQYKHHFSIREEIEERHTLRRISYDDEVGRKNPKTFADDDTGRD